MGSNASQYNGNYNNVANIVWMAGGEVEFCKHGGNVEKWGHNHRGKVEPLDETLRKSRQ